MTPDNAVEAAVSDLTAARHAQQPQVQQQVQVAMHPSQKLVQISTRQSQFDISPVHTFVPFDMLELMYFQMLMVRLQEHGQLQQQPQPTGDKKG